MKSLDLGRAGADATPRGSGGSRSALILVTLAASLLLSGCELVDKMTSFHPGDRNVGIQGANRLSEDLDNINLVKLVDPSYKPTDATTVDIEVALRQFYLDGSDLVRRRNSVQEALIAASDQRCAVYIKYLQAQVSNGNFAFGSLATLAGGLGAMFTHADLARALSGTAGIFSGIRAEYNQDYFANVTANVISHGIQVRRTAIHDQIQRDGQTKSITVYTLEAAIKDAMFYHGECSLSAGLDQAASSIKLTEDPGLEFMTKAVVKVNAMRKALDSGTVDLATVLNGKSPGSASTGQAGTPNGKALDQSKLPIQELVVVTADWPQQFADYTAKTKALPFGGDFENARTAALALANACAAPAIAASGKIQAAETALAAGSSKAAQHDLDSARSAGDAVTAQIDKLGDFVSAALASIDTFVADPSKAAALSGAQAALKDVNDLGKSKSYCQVSVVGPVVPAPAGVAAAPAAAPAHPVAVAPLPFDPATAASVARAQLVLAAAGPLVVDGVMGPGTTAALKSFQSAQTPPLPPTGVLDAATIAALRVQAPPTPALVATDVPTVRFVQQSLIAQRLPVPISSKLKPTGTMDASTVAALVVYQRTLNLPLTGVIDDATLSKLRSS